MKSNTSKERKFSRLNFLTFTDIVEVRRSHSVFVFRATWNGPGRGRGSPLAKDGVKDSRLPVTIATPQLYLFAPLPLAARASMELLCLGLAPSASSSTLSASGWPLP